MSDSFAFTKAVVCGIPQSLPKEAQRQSPSSCPVDLRKAREQHGQYLDALRGLVQELHELPVNEEYPDCVFVEDTVVVCGKKALVTIPGRLRVAGSSLGPKMCSCRPPFEARGDASHEEAAGRPWAGSAEHDGAGHHGRWRRPLHWEGAVCWHLFQDKPGAAL